MATFFSPAPLSISACHCRHYNTASRLCLYLALPPRLRPRLPLHAAPQRYRPLQPLMPPLRPPARDALKAKMAVPAASRNAIGGASSYFKTYHAEMAPPAQLGH
jgi:hypothetical protein